MVSGSRSGGDSRRDKSGSRSGGAWRVGYTDHLVGMLIRCEAAAARVAAADPDRRATRLQDARSTAARHSARLDASPLTAETADAVDRRLATGEPIIPDLPTVHAPSEAGEGWARALKLEGMATQDVAAVEYANLLRAFDAEAGLGEQIFARPLEALRTLHGLISEGLVAPEHVGRLRTTDQAIHDGAQGLVVYHAPPPERLPGLMGELERWLGERSALLPTVVAAGILHERILEWQPFEAANGRLARSASRVVMRARGIDPHGLAVVDAELAADPFAYYAEVAATIRRRGDLVPWSERWAEAVCAALEGVADELDPRPAPTVHSRAAAVVADLPPGATITVTQYTERAAVRRETAVADLRALERAGAVALVPGSGGLRWRRRERVA